MPIVGAVVLLIQFCFAYVGCVIYYFVEVFPDSREHRRARKAARALARALQPDADLKKRAEELEICGSVDNKLALACECMSHRMFVEAAKLYESCLTGAYAADGAILFSLARAAVEGGDRPRGAEVIARVKAAAPKLRPLELRLLEARIHEGRGEYDAALAVYREILPAFVGLEARGDGDVRRGGEARQALRLLDRGRGAMGGGGAPGDRRPVATGL